MEEQLISFETANLAKEKGFNIPCENFYITYIDDDVVDLFNYEEQRGSGFAELYRNNKEFKFSAPTQSLLQKYLRDVHNLYVDSYHDLTADGKIIQYYTSWGFLQQKDINGNQNVNGWYDEYNDWKTYEEALEKGLQEALKLIKK